MARRKESKRSKKSIIPAAIAGTKVKSAFNVGQKVTNNTYIQLQYTRSENPVRLDMGVAGMGKNNYNSAKKMASDLSKSKAVKFIQVFTETRKGAMSSDSKTYKWTPNLGWH